MDTKNKLLINKLVKKHFSLDKSSQKLFNHRLLHERDFPKEYKVVASQKDLRLRKDLNIEELSQFDVSWKNFKNYFPYYLYHNKVTYKNFVDNKIERNKNPVKLLKDLKNFYASKFESLKKEYDEEFFEDFLFMTKISSNGPLYLFDLYSKHMENHLRTKIIDFEYDNNVFCDLRKCSVYFKDDFLRAITESDDPRKALHDVIFVNFDASKMIDKISIYYYDKSFCSSISNKKGNIKNLIGEDQLERIYVSFINGLKERLTNKVTEAFDDIIRNKIFNTSDNLEIVYSLNYADWFLCSTGESWASCISLESSYDECFWTGLPNLIGDKNRILVYITEKGKDKDFFGIKTDRFLFRTWVTLWRQIPQNKEDIGKRNLTFFKANKTYPVEVDLAPIVEKHLGIQSMQTLEDSSSIPIKSIVSRYYLEVLWFDRTINQYKTTVQVYHDIGRFRFAKKNKAKYFRGDYGYLKYAASGSFVAFKYNDGYITEDTNEPEGVVFLNDGTSFDTLVHENMTLLDVQNDIIVRCEEDYEEQYA